MKNDKNNLLRLFKLVKPYAAKFVIAIVCLAMVTVCIIAFTSLVQPIFDEAWTNSNFNVEKTGDSVELDSSFTEKQNALSLARKYLHIDMFFPESMRSPFIMIPILLIFIFILKGIFSYTGNYLMAAVGQSTVRDIRISLYNSIIYQPISFFRRRSTGSLISRIASDVERIQYAVSTNLADLIREALTIVGLSLFVFYLNPMFALVSFLLAPLVLFPVIQLGRRLRKTSRKGQEHMEGLTTRLHETFSGIRIVKAFCAEENEKVKFKTENDRLLKVILKGTKYYSLTAPIMEVIGSMAVAYMIYWGATQIAQGHMTVGHFGVVLAALYQLYNPIKRLSRVNNDLQQAFAAVDRVYEIHNIKNEIEERSDAAEMSDFNREITFSHVDFSYEDRLILKDIDFKVNKGEICAIVGLSGAGKTTLVNLLPRFDEVTSGSITFDDQDIRDFTLKSLRKNIGIVTQETVLFNDTVKNNIAYSFAGKVSDEEIVQAAKAANAYDFIMRTENGFDTVIGESGMKLSGGERQRIAIARALIKNPSILILDEATSALDSESERLVQTALENLMTNRTTFVIAHRLSTVRKADKIIVLSEGQIAERGNHSELKKLNGLYSKLHSLQFADLSNDDLKG